MLLPLWVPLFPTYPIVKAILRGSSRWMSKFHFQTSPLRVSGGAINTAVGGGVLDRNGSLKVSIAVPSRNLRVGTFVVEPSAFPTGMVWKASVMELDTRLPDLGGIRLRMVQLFRCSMLSNQPAPTRTTHLSPGLYAIPTRGMKSPGPCFHSFTAPLASTVDG